MYYPRTQLPLKAQKQTRIKPIVRKADQRVNFGKQQCNSQRTRRRSSSSAPSSRARRKEEKNGPRMTRIERKKGAFKKLQLVHVGVNLVAQLDFNGGS